MAAHDKIHPGQFKLFMSPDEIKSSVVDSVDRGPGEKMDSVWRRKEKEARAPREVDHHGYTEHGSGVYDSIAAEGVTSHVEIYPLGTRDGKLTHAMGNGHHRVAAAAAVERDTGRQQFIPVNYGSVSSSQYQELYPQNKRKGWVG